jgi:hypothetical protein
VGAREGWRERERREGGWSGKRYWQTGGEVHMGERESEARVREQASERTCGRKRAIWERERENVVDASLSLSLKKREREFLSYKEREGDRFSQQRERLIERG